MEIFIDKQLVKKHEIDHLNHVNNVVYLQWINDISIKHWNFLSTKEIRAKYIWVAIRHEIDYLKPAFLDNEITIKTWVATLEGVKSTRKVEIYCNDKLLAKSQTIWCLLDAKTQKITRITNEITAIFEAVL